LYMSIVAGGVLSKTSFPRSLASCPLLGSYSASWVRSLGTWLQFCEAVQKSGSRRSPPTTPTALTSSHNIPRSPFLDRIRVSEETNYRRGTPAGA